MRSRLTLAIVFVALVAGSYLYVRHATGRAAGPVSAPPAVDWQTYRSDRFGVTFRYPATYFLIERDTSTTSGGRHAIVLMEDTPEHRDLAAGRSAAPLNLTS